MPVLCLPQIVFIVPHECELMYSMTEVMAVPVVPKVGHQLVNVSRSALERSSRGEIDISDDFVHPQTAGDVTSFVGLLF